MQQPFKRIPPRGPGKTSAKARVLAQWRGVDLTSEEKARALPAQNVSDMLPKLIKGLKLDSQRDFAEVIKVWNSAVNPTITAHAQPQNLHNGTLFVNVDHSAWLSEIVRYEQKKILELLQNSFGKSVIKKISYKIG